MTGHVGAFYFIGNKIITNDIPVEKGNEYGDYINYSSHWDLWRAFVAEYAEYDFLDYDYFPRGRVIYDKANEKFILYVDAKLNSEKYIRKIEKQYLLDAGYYVQGVDEHYQSQQPMEDMDDDELEEDFIFEAPLEEYLKRETY